MKIVIGIVIILVLLIIILISMYNGFIRLRNSCEEAFSTMDVYLKKRYDLIPNLVETVKGYATHEKETLEKVVAARNAAQGASGKCFAGYTEKLVCCSRSVSGSEGKYEFP